MNNQTIKKAHSGVDRSKVGQEHGNHAQKQTNTF